MKIYIFGIAGSGTTTQGMDLAERLSCLTWTAISISGRIPECLLPKDVTPAWQDEMLLADTTQLDG